MKTENAIKVTNIKKSYGKKPVVQGVSFNVKKGEIFGLLGPNGAGKTTTLKVITTLLRQDEGTVLVNGFNTLTQGRKVRQQFSITGQTAAIDEELSARENLLIFGRLNGLTGAEAQTRANELLLDFDLSNSADQALATFSGGMRRRLDLAISLIGRPSILFLDEPTTGLDPRTRKQMWQAIQKLVSRGTTVLLTTQYLEEADSLADRIALIDHGRMITVGTPSELKQQIGGMQMRVEITNRQKLSQAEAIIKDVLSLPVSIDDRVLTTLLDNIKLQQVPQVLAQLQKMRISYTNLTIGTHSLDDVFMKLTVGKN